ncbi:AAA family ATPase [Lyngbya confervoides]|uniref:AAA family ATPase n=1 Tax=Lyngbya confervoides BDU141951 TaxID=1574623 RepID=A0ABD4T1X2_9CYAN|nr:AAA family ATPase [Lyngbya confervoides]MCM1982257.1 AAA family ATPase [Lyngbya confervoides BDU141951]
MTTTLYCHCLMGVPGSGKSTLAQQWLALDPSLVVIAPDAIRDELYGDPIIQGDWEAVNAEVRRQFQGAIQAHRSVIYDATNVKRSWRRDLIGAYPQLQWLGWILLTPVKICLERNQQRDRQVPLDVIIDYAQLLNQQPPRLEDGFAALYEVPLREVDHTVDWPQFQAQIQDLPQMTSSSPSPASILRTDQSSLGEGQRRQEWRESGWTGGT